MKVFVLEDEIDRYPRNQIVDALKSHTLTLARSCEDAIKNYDPPYDLLLLDHDMEGDYEYRKDYPNTGMQFVKWLVTQPLKGDKPEVVLHSHNPVGRQNMKLLLEDYGFIVLGEHPFGPGYVKLLKNL